MAILLALVAAASFGILDYFNGHVTKTVSAYVVLFWMYLVTVIVVWPFLWVVKSELTLHDTLWVVSGNIAATFALVIFYRALARGRMSVISPITGATSGAVPVVVGLLSGERPNLLVMFALVGVIAAIALVGAGEGSSDSAALDATDSKPLQNIRRDIGLALLAGTLIGVFFSTSHHAYKTSGLWPVMLVALSSTVALAPFARSGMSFRVARELPKFVYLSGLMNGVALISLFYANRSGLLAIVGVIVALSPAYIVTLAAVVDKEKIHRIQAIGLALAAISVAVIAAAA